MTCGLDRQGALAMNDFPDYIISTILEHLLLGDVIHVIEVSRRFHRLSMLNKLWRNLARAKWPGVQEEFVTDNWFQFYRMRHNGLHSSTEKVNGLIDNCIKWKFKCPLTVDKLLEGTVEGARYCNVCEKSVYYVHSMAELTQKVQQNKCVIVDFNGEIADYYDEDIGMGDWD
eukprot:Phypoly_transcript_15531.p1 GENE.Phypoly_transcript_15531~~Phypoly_transcript_15531.p1  ORF type:complete len:172 (+),score=13.01 Phypoly_transcript_15531:336-851(+)